MKRILLFCVFTVLGVMGSVKNAGASGDLSIYSLMASLARFNGVPNTIVGWERLSFLSNSISDSEELTKAIAEANLDKISKMVSEKTSYRLIVGRNSFIIVPKVNLEKYDTPLVERIVAVPSVRDFGVNDFLHMLQGKDANDLPVHLTGPMVFNSQIRDGKVTFQQSNEECGRVLNEISRQIGARFWIVDHLISSKPESQAGESPVKLGAGSVSFYSGGGFGVAN